MTVGCCEVCGAHLLGRPRPLAITTDSNTVWRRVLCVRCRDTILEAVTEAADDALVGVLVEAAA